MPLGLWSLNNPTFLPLNPEGLTKEIGSLGAVHPWGLYDLQLAQGHQGQGFDREGKNAGGTENSGASDDQDSFLG